jgi:hypothetical protein
MAQTLPPTPLPEELTGTQGQAPVAPGDTSVREGLGQLAEGPIDDFLMELLSIADELGILDQAFQEPSVADQADELDANADPFEMLNQQQLTILVQKYMAIPEPQRTQIGVELANQLPPQVADRLAAIVRFVGGRDAQQVVAQ